MKKSQDYDRIDGLTGKEAKKILHCNLIWLCGFLSNYDRNQGFNDEALDNANEALSIVEQMQIKPYKKKAK